MFDASFEFLENITGKIFAARSEADFFDSHFLGIIKAVTV